MVKRIIVYAALLLSNVAIAQTKNLLHSTVFVKAGYNMANITKDNNGNVDKSNQLSSFHVGLMSDLPITPFVSIQAGLLFTGKGAKTEFGQPGQIGYYKATTNPMYVEMPVSFVGKIPLGLSKAPKVLFGAGPYVAMGVAGKNKTEYQAPGVVVYGEKNIEFDSDNTNSNSVGYPRMKRLDYGLNLLTGIEFSRLNLTVNYGYGLAKLIPGTNDNSNDKGKNRVLALSVGIKL